MALRLQHRHLPRTAHSSVTVDQKRPGSCRPTMDVPFRPSIMTYAPLSPSVCGFVPGRDRHTGAMEQRFSTDDDGNSPSSPLNVDSRNYHHGGDTAPASSSPAALNYDVERASSSRASSQTRRSPFTTPASSSASVGGDPYPEDFPRGHVQKNASTGPPANAPKGPSGRQRQSNYSATRQNGPPPNAPTGPAAMRKQDGQRKKCQPRQEPIYLTEGKASWSMSWKSSTQQQYEGFEKYKNRMNIMGIKNESISPNLEEYMLLRERCINRNLRLGNIRIAAKSAIREARDLRGKTDVGREEEVRKLQEEKLTQRDLFTPFFMEMWWGRAVPAVGSNVWPSAADQKRVGDGNKSRNLPRSLCPPPENKAWQDGVDANKRDKPASYFLMPVQKTISEERALEMLAGDPELNHRSWYPRELIEFIDKDTDRKIWEEENNKERQLQEKEIESGGEAWRKYLVE